MGYYKPSGDLQDYRQAIIDYQTFYRLKVTGEYSKVKSNG